MIYLLDANVVTQTSKQQPNVAVMNWWKLQDEFSLMLSAIVFQELRFGVEILQPGRRRHRLEEWLEVRLRSEFSGRILPVTVEIADLGGKLIADRKKEAHILDPADALIAATARVHGFQIATLNRKHFVKLGVGLVEF